VTTFGYTLSSEEHPPGDLVRNARRAEEEGFVFVSMSDHFHPWVGAQGHSPFVWSVLGAVAATTEHLRIGVGVTCPIIRIHPAIIAHATATTARLSEGRFFLGVGTGEALNEHVLGDPWPPAEDRLGMLEEAVAIIRALWTGDTLDHHGDYYDVVNAKLFDPPTEPPSIFVSGFGEKSISLAARIGDGYWGHTPTRDPIEQYRREGGSGPRIAQVDLCWADDVASARKTVHQVWPNGGVPGQLSQDLPTWVHFEDVSSLVTEDVATESVPCGPEVGPVLDSVRSFVDAGYDHLYFHQIGPDQEGFFRFWSQELRPALSDMERIR
jgi:coenzyme F420-dependent glucose-6-phosphate dehydrogenase